MECQKILFDLPEGVIYLNNAGASPLLKGVALAGAAGIHVKTHPWNINSDVFFKVPEQAKELFATLIQTQKENIALVPSATYGVETAMKNLKLNPGDEILLAAEEFPALVLPCQKKTEESEATLKFVKKKLGETWTDAFLKELSPKTRFVGFGLSHWTDGAMIDASLVTRRAHEKGAVVFIDACQSVGAFAIDINEIQADYLVAPTYKWLMGPYSFGFLYVALQHQQGVPLEQYWASRCSTEDFQKLTQYEPTFREGAAKFDMSEKSQFINAPMAVAALSQILNWSPKRMAAYTQPLVERMAEEFIRMGWSVPARKERSPHFVGVKKDGGFCSQFKETLLQQNIHVSFRGECMRVSVSVYNSEKEIEAFLLVCRNYSLQSQTLSYESARTFV